MISKSHDSSTHPMTRNSQITLQLKLWAVLVPLPLMPALKVPVLAHRRPPPVPTTSARHQSPAQELLLLAQQLGLLVNPQRPGPAGPPDPPPTGPSAQLSGPGRGTGPSGLGRPTPAASPFSGPRRRQPCLRTQPATSLLRLFQQGPCPRPPAPRRPSPPARPGPAVSSHPPSPPRCPPTAPGAPWLSPAGAEVRLELPPLAAGRPGPAHYLGTPLALLSSGGSAAARPPHPAAPGLASRPAPCAPPSSSTTTAPRSPGRDRRAAPRAGPPGRGEEKEWGATRAGRGGREGGPASWAGGAVARTEHRAPAPHSAGAAPAPALAAGGRGLAGGPGAIPGPSAEGAAPVVPPGAGPRKPGAAAGSGSRTQSPRARRPRAAQPPNCPPPRLTCHSGGPAPDYQPRKEGRGPAARAFLVRVPAGLQKKGRVEAAFSQ